MAKSKYEEYIMLHYVTKSDIRREHVKRRRKDIEMHNRQVIS